jgi:hypothetical protein
MSDPIMTNRLIAILFFSWSISLHAEVRPWKSADGLRTIQGEFVKRDDTSITIRDKNGKSLTIELSKLHLDELKWLKANHPIKTTNTVFDTLTFDDDRNTALVKLKASKVVVMTLDETFIGRSGLNGVFSTRQKMGKLAGSLYFDWTDAGKLKEVTLQTDTLPTTDYESVIKPSWEEFVKLLDTLYGKPLQAGPLAAPESLTDGMFAPSHLWNLDGMGSVILGIARDGKKIQLAVRFTQKKIEPVETP